MKLEKIKNYNHWLLAVLGTIIACFGLVGLIALIVTLTSSFFPGRHYDDSGLLSDSKVEELKKDNLRQIISLESPVLIDTINTIYYIPVSNKNIENLETIDERVNSKLDISPNYRYEKDYSSSDYYNYKATTNIIIYDQPKKEAINIFNRRIFVGTINTHYNSGEIYLVCRGVGYDSDKDGRMNLNDYNSLYIYSVKAKKLNEISIPESNIIFYEFVASTKKVIVTIGIDRNKDGVYNSESEPSSVQEYDLETGKLASVVDDKITATMQELVDGKGK